MSTNYSLIDLFCGCGGLTKGFMDTGRYTPVWANDNNKESVLTYCANFDPQWKHTSLGNIEAILKEKNTKIPKADIVVGGPPCQGFSLLNRNRGVHDYRRSLWYHFLKVAETSKAKLIVMENVPQLLTSPEFEDIIKNLKELKYKYIMASVVNSANFGVPQTRRRALILASKNNRVALPFPEYLNNTDVEKARKYSRKKFKPWKTVKDAIFDLPEPKGVDVRAEEAPLNLHFGRTPTATSIERYKAIPNGGNRFDLHKNRPDITPECWKRKKSGGTDLFGRLWWDRPSVTIRTEFFKPEKGRYLHPSKHRPITHREAARLQSFPDKFKLVGSKTEIAKQIGNAVPVLLANAIAKRASQILAGEIDAETVEETKDFYTNVLNAKVYVF